MSPTEPVPGAVDAPAEAGPKKGRRGPPPAAAPLGAVYGLGFIGAVVYYI